MSPKHLFVIGILLLQEVLCSKKLCDFDNIECITAAVRRVRSFSITRPIQIDLIEEELPTVKYTLRNALLSGINTCVSESLKIHTTNLTYEYTLVCKHLVMDGLYYINGDLGPMHIQGNGEFRVDYDDYAFIFTGEAEQNIDKDGKIYNRMKNFNLEINPRAAAVQKYVCENGITVNKILRQPVMEQFMTILVERINEYLQKVPIEDLFTEDK